MIKLLLSLLVFPFLLSAPPGTGAMCSGEGLCRSGQVSVQCNGITKTGKQCKNKTNNSSGYCYVHENQNITSGLAATNTKQSLKHGLKHQCSGVTKAGKQCSRMTTNASGRCFQHGN